MAKVATAVYADADSLLDYLTTEWRKVPAVARMIGTWDLIDQIDYVEEWAPKESLLDRLHRLMAAPEVNSDQRARYEELQQIIERNRPLLDELRRS